MKKLFEADVNLGALEAIEVGIDMFLAAVGKTFPEVYYNVTVLRSTNAGTEVIVHAISENQKQLKKFGNALDIDSENYDFETFSEDNISKLVKVK